MENEFRIIGRVSQEPKLIITKLNQIPFTNLNVAVSKRIKKQDGPYQEVTDFIKTSCWRNLAEYISKYVSVGDLVLVKGHIKVSKDFDTERMTNIYTTDLVGDSIKIIVKNKPKEEIKQEQPKQVGFKTSYGVDDLTFTEDELPF